MKQLNSRYSEMFEGKFTETLLNSKHTGLANLYFNHSPSTFTQKSLKGLFEELGGHEYKILDLGCGGGNELLIDYGYIVGVDVSKASVDNAKLIYDEAMVLDVSKGLPFDDDSFDVIFSSEVLGHIFNEHKDFIIKECQRILKPSGHIIGSIETFGDNWLTRRLIQKGVYDKLWIDPWGHVGLETYDDCVGRLSKSFKIIKHWPGCTTIFPADVIVQCSSVVSFASILRTHSMKRIYNLLISPWFKASVNIKNTKQANNIIFLAKNIK